MSQAKPSWEALASSAAASFPRDHWYIKSWCRKNRKQNMILVPNINPETSPQYKCCPNLPCPYFLPSSHGTDEAKRSQHSWSHLSPWKTRSYLPTPHKRRRLPDQRKQIIFGIFELKASRYNPEFLILRRQSWQNWTSPSEWCHHMLLLVFIQSINWRPKGKKRLNKESLSCNSLHAKYSRD